MPTDKRFTGQRLDSTGLYYYNARYYDPQIGRFISPDPITHSQPLPNGQIIKGLTVYCTSVQYYTGQTRTPATINPQEHNRYSYALNNPLKYYDPDGHQVALGLEYIIIGLGLGICVGYYYCAVAPALEQQGVDTSINSALSYARNAAKENLEKTVSFFKNMNPFKKDDKKPDNKPEKRYETPEGYKPPKYNDNPAQSPGEGWKWEPPENTPESRKGNWHNPETGESIHPDVPHGKYGSHNDWIDPMQRDWRLYPDGSIEPKGWRINS